MLAEFLMPIPEKSYIRVVYLGRLQLLPNPKLNIDDEKSDKVVPKPTLEEMLKEIWAVASKFNTANFISGHLACSKTLHCVQLLEGEERVVSSLMKRIRKDPRVIIERVFKKRLLSMNSGWTLSTCYSFAITPAELAIVKNDISLKKMFHMMKNTYQAVRENLKLPTFYKNVIETMLLKYIAVTEENGLVVLKTSKLV